MKKILLLLCLPLIGFSQSNYLAFSKKNEVGNFGTIIEITDDIPQTKHDFNDNGQFPYDYMVEVNQKIYGVTEDNGGLNGGTFYEYDLINNTFEILIHFEPVGSNSYFNNLCAGNGKIYGIRTDFFSGRTLIEYDIANQTITSLVSLSSNGIDADIKDLEFINNKIYGLTDLSSSGTAGNILFSYDLNNNTYNSEFIFNTTDGNFCHSILAHSNGNIYGATTYGGANSEGVIFEFDTTTNTYNKLYDLTSSEKADNLTEGDSNNLYGYVNPITGGGGRIYKFDLTNNSFTNLHYFSSGFTLNGNEAWFRDFFPPVFDNGYIYGVSGTSDAYNALLFKYDININSLTEISIKRPSSSLMLSSNGQFLYQSKFETSNGGLMEYNNNTDAVDRINEANFGNHGLNPYKMIKSSSGLVYGITYGESANVIPTGVRLFSYNPNTDEYNVLVNCEEESYGTLPTDIIETTNGKIYFYNSYQASTGGKLIEYDPSTNTHSLAYDFGSLYENSVSGESIQFFENDNILYGVVGYAGNETNTTGIIFSYNTLTNTFNNLYQSDNIARTRWSYLSSNNIIYGATFSPGVNTGDFSTYKDLFSYNLNTNSFSFLETNIGGTISSNPTMFIETESEDVFGYFTNTNSTNGKVFKIDTNTNMYSVFYDFGTTTGGAIPYNPYGIQTVNNKIYIPTKGNSGTSFARNLLLEFDSTDSTAYNTILDVTTTDINLDEIINSEMYVTNDNKLLGSTDLYAFSFTQGEMSTQPIFNFNSEIETAFSFIDLNDSQLSINDYDLINNVSIYPNPTTDYINIKTNNPITKAELYNLHGQKVNASFSNNIVDVQNITNGVYFLKIKTAKGEVTKKVIKQ